MPKQVGSPYAPKGCRPNIGARCGTESTAENGRIIDPGGKPHGPAVDWVFIVAEGGGPSLGDGDQLAQTGRIGVEFSLSAAVFVGIRGAYSQQSALSVRHSAPPNTLASLGPKLNGFFAVGSVFTKLAAAWH
jgi:hypothetical protein